MTLGAHEIGLLKEHLLDSSKAEATQMGSPISKVKPVSGAAFFARAQGLLTLEEVDRLEKNIQESCEQVDD